MFQSMLAKIFNPLSDPPETNNPDNGSKNDLTIFKNIMLIIFILLLGFFAYKIQTILILFFASFVIASAIDPSVEFLSRKMPRKVAILLIAAISLVIMSVFLIPLINILIKQTLLLLEQAPIYWTKIQTQANILIIQTNQGGLIGILNNLGLGQLASYIKNINVLPDTSGIISTASQIGQNIISGSVNLTKGFISTIIFIFTSAIIIIYMLMDKYYLKEKFLSLFPENGKSDAETIGGLIAQKTGGYVISLLVMVLAVGLIITTGLALIGVNYFLVLGLIAAVLDIIPIVGPIIGATIVILVSLAQKPILALWALIIYIAAGWITDTFIRPVVYGKFLNLHPLTLIFSLLAGTAIFGFIGVILAPAFAATISVLIDELYIKKISKEKTIQ
ncbi:MAG: hypothetical protein ACD_20C00109G0033 [uncultured bacterium]|nr:MAG: hypothetical protein ACD_20C00109G0033 [uncultured bacterium]HBH17957.1 hypothetical protein [Cyanobacteria bacterium UBA9579]